MYAPNLNTKDRSGAIVAAFAVQVALVAAFLNLPGQPAAPDAQPRLRLVDYRLVPARRIVHEKPVPARKSGGTRPSEVKNVATALVAVPAIISQAIDVVTTKPNDEADVISGAAAVRGAGGASGGNGRGTGAGTGSGTQDGTDLIEPPHLATPVLSGSDFPAYMVHDWPRSDTVYLRLKVDARGYVAECLIDRGTRVPIIDSAICNTAHERLRFHPALNRNGEPVAGWFGYAQPSPR